MPAATSDIVQFIKSTRNLYIVFSTDLDAIIASSLLMRVAREEGIETYLAPFYEAPKPMDLNASVLLVKVLQKAPVGGIRVFQLDDLVKKDPKIVSSSTIYLIKELKKQIVMPRYVELLSLVAVVSISRGPIYDQNVVEIHKPLVEEAIDKNLFSILDTLRLFGYPRRDIIEALAKTIDPYILGVSLDYEGSKKVLEEVGGTVASEEAKAKLVEALASRLSSYCKVCEPISGPKIVIKDSTSPIEDVYETVYAFYCYMDMLGVEPLVYLGINSKVVELAKGALSYMFKPLREILDSVVESSAIKKLVIRGVKVSVIDLSTVKSIPPLFTTHRVLRSLGLTEDVTVFSSGKEYLLPVHFVAPRWPYDRELNVEKNFISFSSLQDIGEVFK